MKLLFGILLLVGLTQEIGFSQEYSFADFTETKIPRVSTNEWFDLNQSRNEFRVAIEEGQLVIDKATPTNTDTLQVKDGELIGTDHGEWGGQIGFHPKGSQQYKLIKEGNVKFIFKYENEIYFIEGLAHLAINEGTMYRLEGENGDFHPIKVLEFEDAPEAMTIKGDTIFIASHQNFYIIQGLNKETIFENAFWSSLYPNSIAVIDNKNIYIGIRSGIVKVDLPDKQIRFYKYSKPGG